MRVHRLHRPKRALHAGVVEHVDVTLGNVCDRRERSERLRVVDEPVDATEPFECPGDHGLDLIPMLDVAHDAVVRDPEVVELATRLRHEVVFPLGDDDLRAPLAEVQRHPLADPLARARDDHDLAGDRVHVSGGAGRGGS